MNEVIGFKKSSMPDACNYSNNSWFAAVGIVLMGVIARLYGITSPLVDALQLKQAHTAMIARNLFQDGMNILCTRFDHFDGCYIVEFPIMHSLTALLYYVFGVHELLGRVVSLAFSVGAMLFLYALARRFLPVRAALAALALYAFSPTNLYVSRAFMVESSMLFFSIAAVYFFMKWLDDRSGRIYAAAIVCAALACLAKPTAALILVPIVVAAWTKMRWNVLRRSEMWVYLVLALAPAVLWALYGNEVNAENMNVPGNYMGIWTSYFKRLGDTLTALTSMNFYTKTIEYVPLSLLTPLGFVGMIAGCFFIPSADARKILVSWLAVTLCYLFVFADVSSSHPYHHLLLLPVASILFGFAAERVMQGREALVRRMFKSYSSAIVSATILILVIACYFVGYIKFFSYMYDVSSRMPHVLEIADVVRKNTDDDAIILLNQPHVLPAVLGYYSKRQDRWFKIKTDKQAIDELENQRTKGATTYVAIDTKYGSGVKDTYQHEAFNAHLKNRYRLIAQSDYYLIYDLR
jgi:4-amino-4-deoxy-L-arabinose transferase-like glycosyltransferase